MVSPKCLSPVLPVNCSDISICSTESLYANHYMGNNDRDAPPNTNPCLLTLQLSVLYIFCSSYYKNKQHVIVSVSLP